MRKINISAKLAYSKGAEMPAAWGMDNIPPGMVTPKPLRRRAIITPHARMQGNWQVSCVP